MTDNKSFKEVQREWYEKLKESGFEDAENTSNPDRPLKSWHSFKPRTIRNFAIIQANRSQYQKEIDDFINHPDFESACLSLTKHGNCKFKVTEIKLIWQFHTEGQTRREIARYFGRAKSRIDDIIEGLRTWMKLL